MSAVTGIRHPRCSSGGGRVSIGCRDQGGETETGVSSGAKVYGEERGAQIGGPRKGEKKRERKKIGGKVERRRQSEN